MLELVPPPLVLLIAVGGRTHPGYRAITEWLAQQVPARVEEYPERSHFDPPHLAEVEC